MSNHHLAKAAYVAFVETMNWRDASGNPLPQFTALPEAEQRAWSRAAENTLKEWLDTNFRRSLLDRERISACFLAELQLGLRRGDDIFWASSVALASYVMELVDPLAARRSQIE